MAANFWLSSHAHRLVDRQTLIEARSVDIKYASSSELIWIDIWGANAIHKLAKELGLRQQVTATAIVFLRRFYLRNNYCETEPCIVIAACVYLSAKAEETPVNIKTVMVHAKNTFTTYGVTTFPSDASKLAEMEFYLLEDIEFDLVVYHPYKSLLQITGRDSSENRTKEKNNIISDSVLQYAWFIINDTYRSQLSLVYPPYVVAISALFLGLAMAPRGGAARSKGTDSKGKTPITGDMTAEERNELKTNILNVAEDMDNMTEQIQFLATLNVQMEHVTEIIQEIVALYTVWDALDNQPTTNQSAGAGRSKSRNDQEKETTVVSILRRMRNARNSETSNV